MIYPPEQTEIEQQREHPQRRLISYDADLDLYEEQMRYQAFEEGVVKDNRRRKQLILLSTTLVLLICIGIGAYFFYQQINSHSALAEAQNQINEAHLAIQSGDYESATRIYKALAASRPQDASVLLAINELGKELNNRTTMQSTAGGGESQESSVTDEQLLALQTEADVAFNNQNWLLAAQLYEQIRTTNSSFQPQTITTQLLQAYGNGVAQILALGQTGGGDLNVAADFLTKAVALNPADLALRARSDYLRKYLDAEQLLRQNEPQQALVILLPLRQVENSELADETINLLYRTYLAMGDQAIRAQKLEDGEQYYARAGELNVLDTSKLQKRLDSLPLLTSQPAQPSAPVAVAAPSVPQEVAVEPAAAPSAEPEASPTPPAQATSVAACADSRSTITSPGNNAVLSGVIDIIGTAQDPKFNFYKVEYAPTDTMEFVYYSGSETPISEWILGSFDTTIFPNGDYVLRLVVVDETGNYPPPCQVRVKIANGVVNGDASLPATDTISTTETAPDSASAADGQ